MNTYIQTVTNCGLACCGRQVVPSQTLQDFCFRRQSWSIVWQVDCFGYLHRHHLFILILFHMFSTSGPEDKPRSKGALSFVLESRISTLDYL